MFFLCVLDTPSGSVLGSMTLQVSVQGALHHCPAISSSTPEAQHVDLLTAMRDEIYLIASSRRLKTPESVCRMEQMGSKFDEDCAVELTCGGIAEAQWRHVQHVSW